jgi:hypothetical protein
MKMRFALLFCCLFVLTGCRPANVSSPTPNPIPSKVPTPIPSSTPSANSPNAQPANQLQEEPYKFKTSDPGFATLEGLLLVMDPLLALPDANDAIFLVPLDSNEGVVTIPQFVVGEVPQADVDERTGDFRFTNIKPGRYVVVVLTTGGTQIPVHFDGSGSLAIIKIEEPDIDTTIKLDNLRL